MATATVQIKTFGFGLVRLGELPWLHLMLVAMVSQVLGSYANFVLAIGGRCSPGELHRNYQQQENGKPFAHRQHCSSFIFKPVH